MITAVDTSVLLAIYRGEDAAEAWMAKLVAARSGGALIVCEVVYAEFGAAFSEQSELDRTLDDLGVAFDGSSREAAFAAGRAFKAYRAAGGPRERMIPDFLIAAHAHAQADRLFAADRGYARTYFPKLKLVDV